MRSESYPPQALSPALRPGRPRCRYSQLQPARAGSVPGTEPGPRSSEDSVDLPHIVASHLSNASRLRCTQAKVWLGAVLLRHHGIPEFPRSLQLGQVVQTRKEGLARFQQLDCALLIALCESDLCFEPLKPAVLFTCVVGRQ